MMRSSGRKAYLVWLSALTLACVDENGVTRPEFSRAAQSAASVTVARNYDGELYVLTESMPEFAGFWMDRGNWRIAAVGGDAAVLRSKARDYLAQRGHLQVADLEVVQVQHTFRELYDYRARVRSALPQLSGGSLDISERRNAVVVGVYTAEDLARVQSALSSIDIPQSALRIELVPEAGPTNGNLTDTFTSKVGGILVSPPAFCTLGMNVEGSSGQRLFITNSHCTYQGYGFTGNPAYQDSTGTQEIGYEVYDPPIAVNYYSFPQMFACDGTIPNYDECRLSDAALLLYHDSISSDLGYLAKPFGPPGTSSAGSIVIDTIAPRFHITGWADFAYSFEGFTVYKVGKSSGWTEHEVLDMCADLFIGQGQVLLCQAKTDGYLIGGDSGSPVFGNSSGTTLTGTNVVLYGIMHHGSPNANNIFFSPMPGIYHDLSPYFIDYNMYFW